ncbi:Hint domain-containing protein [Loktanella sp. DJP18]|uniref:Hint domain-containing protein n=1 Tax=Loktanella sp. DJP18 TaxID=3409788 RepID=UPI003BB791B4
MNWLGLRDPTGGVFSPAGLGQPAPCPAQPDELLATGTLLLDCNIMPSLTEQTLLSYQAMDPWRTALTVALDPKGTLIVTQAQGEDTRRYTLATGLMGRAMMTTIVFAWDAPHRRARLSAEVPDTGALWFTTGHGPLPLSLRDATRIVMDRHRCHVMPGTGFAAIAEGMMPIGPLPSLDAATLIPTPQGDVALDSLRPGQIVRTVGGGTAQVRWTGGLTLPARGRFAPLHLRAPFYGAQRDIHLAPCQQVHLRSSEVEYLFATHTVAARAGDLLDGIGPRAIGPAPTIHYRQLVLDRPAAVSVHGVACATLDTTAVVADPALRAQSILRDVPMELMPQTAPRDVQRLQGFETRSLCELRVA